MLAVKTSEDVSALFTVESRFQTAIPSAKPAAIAAPSAVVSGIDGRTNIHSNATTNVKFNIGALTELAGCQIGFSAVTSIERHYGPRRECAQQL